MIEFKFSCPSCAQHLQVTNDYSGRQINCPACQKLLVVPPPPSAPPSPASAVLPPSPVKSPPAGRQMPRPTITAKKSNPLWLVLGSTAGLAVVGALVFVLFIGRHSHPTSKSAGETQGPATPTTDLHSPSAAEIVRKVTDQYQSFTSYSASGTTLSIIDMSKVDMKNLPGMDKLPAAAKTSPEMQQTMSKPLRMENAFTVKLGKPGFYLVTWETKSGPGNMQGAVWSAGAGDFLCLTKTKYTKLASRDLALASATGISSGVAGTLPAIFFQTPSSPLNFFKTAERSTDETVAGEDCYVLNGNAMGMKMILWVAKSTYLIKQKQMVLGGQVTMPDVSDANMDAGLKQAGNLTPEQKAQAKATMKIMKPLLSQMKGTMTETYQAITTNQPVKPEDFTYDLPPGAVLSQSLF